MASSETTVSTILKEQFLPDIQEMWENGTGVLDLIQKNKVDGKGGDLEKRVRLTRNHAIASLRDGATLPTAGNSTYGQYTIDPKFHYARVQVSGIAMARTAGGVSKSLVETLVDEVESTVNHFKKRMNIQAWRAEEGYLARVASVASQVITLDDAGVAGAVALGSNDGCARLGNIAGDIKLDAIDSDGSTIHFANATVSALSRSGPTVTMAAGVDCTALADGDFLAMGSMLSTSDTWSSDCLEGIMAAVDNTRIRTSYHGLNKSTYPILQSNVLENTSAQRDLSEGLLEDLFQTVEVNAGIDVAESPGYQIRLSPGLYAAFKAQQIGLKRYPDGDLGAGGKNLRFNGIEVVRDVDAPFEMAWLLNFDKFYCAEALPLQWLDKDGSVIQRVATQDAYEARLAWFSEVFARDVHCMGVIRNLNDTPYDIRS